MPDDIVATLVVRVMATGQNELRALSAEAQGLGASMDSSFGRASASLGRVAIGIGAVSAIMGGVAVKAAMDFQSSMEMIATQAGASQDEVKRMSAAVLQMAQDTGTAPQQLAAGLFHIESAGLRGAVALDTLRAAAEGAKIGHADLEAVTNALIGVENSHIAGVHGEIDAMAALNAIVGSGNMHLQDLTAALATGILPAARTAGLTLQDVGAALAVMTDQGIPASRAATQLSLTFAKMEAPNKAAAAAFASIGLSTTQLALDMRKPEGLLVALTDLKTHLEAGGKSAVDQAQIIVQAFGGGRMSKGVMELIDSLDQLKKKYAEQAQIAGQFTEDWIRTEATTAAGMEHLRANVDVLAIEIGAALLPAVNSVLTEISPAAAAMDHWAKANQDLARDILIAGLAVGAFGLALKGVEIGMGLARTASTIATGAIGLFTAGSKQATEATAAAGATAARTTPDWALLNATWARFAVTLPAVAAEEVRVGEAAAAALPEIVAYDRALGAMRLSATGLLVPLAAMPAEITATGEASAIAGTQMAAMTAETEASTAALGARGLTGVLADLNMGPAGWAMMAATLGVIAYTTMPAVRQATNDLADAFKQKLYEGALVAQMGLIALTESGKSASAQAEATGGKLDLLKTKTNDFFGLVQQGAKSAWDTSLPGQWGNAAGGALDSLTKKQRDYNALVAEGRQRLQDYYALEKGVAQAAGGGVSQMAIDISASDFVKGSSDAKKKFEADLAALADQIVSGNTNLSGFVHELAGAQVGLSAFTNAQTEAALDANLASGRATDAVTHFVDSLKSKATQAIDLWAVGVVRGAGNLKQLEAAAIGAAKNQVLYDSEIKRVTAEIGKLVPGFADLNAKVPTAAQAMAKAAKAGEDFATALSQKSTRSFDSLVEAVYKGKTHLDGLTDAAIKAAEHSNRWTQTSEQVRLKIDEAAHNWAAALDDMRKILDDRLSSAQGRLQVDRREGAPSSVISGDEAKVKKAQDALTAFEAQTKKSTKSLDDFSTEQTAADKRTKSALDAYALGLMTNAKDLPALRAAYLAAGTESLKFADALKKAEAALKAHESAYQHLQQGQSDAQAKLNNAIALGVQDIQQHGHVTAAHALQIEKDRAALALLTKQTNDAATVGEKLKQSFSDLQTAAQKGATDALDTLAMALLHHASNVGNLADKALFAALASKRFADALTQATQMVALAMGDFTTYLSGLSDAVKKAIDKLATDTYTGAANTPVPLTPQQTKANQILTGQGEPTPFPRGSNGTVGDQDIQAIITAQNNYKAGLIAQTSALLKAAAATGDWSAALASVRQQTTDAMNNATAEYVTAVLGLGGSILEATLRIKAAATEQERQNLADAAAAAAVAVAMEQAAVAAGDFAGAFNIQKGIDTKAYQQSIDTIAGKILGHVAVTQADIDAAQAHRIAVEADTQANWDATFAAASVTEKHNMLAQAASGVISRFNSIQGAQSAVDNANLAVLAAQSAVQVGLLQDLVTDTQDQTAVIQASAGVAKAVGDIALVGIKDQAGIITAQGAIAQAKDAAALAVAQDQLRIAIDTRAADIAAAQWAAVMARDNLTIARDKSAADKANEAAQHVVEMDKLKVAIDQVQLTKDQMVLQMDTLQGVDIIASAFADVTAYEAKIQSDLSAIGADQGQIGADQLQLGKDTATAAQVAAQGALTVAQDQQRLAMDQAAGDASSQAGQMRIALDQNQLARDQVAAQNKTNSLLAQGNSFLQSQMGAMLEALKNFRSGVTYHWIGSGPDPFESWLNGAQAQFAGNPSL